MQFSPSTGTVEPLHTVLDFQINQFDGFDVHGDYFSTIIQISLEYEDYRTRVSDGKVDNIDIMNKYVDLGLIWFPEFRPLDCSYDNSSWVG